MQDLDAIKWIYRRLDDHPLTPGDELYVPLHEGAEDPVELLAGRIRMSETQSLHLLSGFRGCGKTTELLRLKQKLEGEGYLVLYADALDYFDHGARVDIGTMMLVLAGSFSDSLQKATGDAILSDSYWTRLAEYLHEVSIVPAEIGIGTEAKLPSVLGGSGAKVDLKLELKQSPEFRSRLRSFLSERIGATRQKTMELIQEGVKAVRRQRGNEDRQIVFLFDSLEQFRGSLLDAPEVIGALTALFRDHLDKLRIPFVHVVYTPPPWLKFMLPGLPMPMIPSVKLWEKEARGPSPAGIENLRQLVEKRFSPDGLRRAFPEGDTSFGRLIVSSGGDLRDLLRLFRETLLRTRAFPVPASAVEAAITAVRSSYLPIPNEDKPWLEEVARTRGGVLSNRDEETVWRLTLNLDQHVILYFTNGHEWYDVHPLVRDQLSPVA